MEIILCRHTQTNDNARRIYSGHNDVELNEIGWKQARPLAHAIGRLPVRPGAVLSSDLRRTASLANLIGEQIGVVPVLDLALREVHIGRMAGVVREEALKRFPAERHRTANPDFDFSDIGGESAQAAAQRQTDFLESQMRLLRRRGVARIVVVGHGTALRLLFLHRRKLIPHLHDQGHYQLVEWR